MSASNATSKYQFHMQQLDIDPKDVPGRGSGVDSYSVYKGAKLAAIMSIHRDAPVPPPIVHWSPEAISAGFHYEKADAQGNRQGTLFGLGGSAPGRREVFSLFAERAHRGVVPTLLGIAEHHAQNLGQTLVPSTDLSEHSSRLVGHLKRKGVLGAETSDPEEGGTNAIQFSSLGYVQAKDRQGQPIPEHQVKAGRATARRLARRPPKQGTLF